MTLGDSGLLVTRQAHRYVPAAARDHQVVDRLHDSKLAQAYGMQVPVRERPVGCSVK